MTIIHQTITADNVAGYYIEASSGVESTLGQRLFPSTKQAGLTLDLVKGNGGRPVALRAAAFDSRVTLADRPEVEITSVKMPLFKEALLLKEEDIIRINELSGNPKLQETVFARAFKDDVRLITSAKVRLEALRMELLATGVIAVKSNGVAQDYDYGVTEAQKAKTKVAWSDPSATPLADFEKAIDAATERGYTPEVVLLNNTTFNQLKNHASTIAVIDPAGKKQMTAAKFKEYLKEEFNLTAVEVVNETYRDDNGNTRKYFPDNRVTFLPNATLGETVFGTTAEESHLMAGNQSNVQIVEEGIAVTVTPKHDPVNVETKVSMIALPSFDAIDSAYFLETIPSV